MTDNCWKIKLNVLEKRINAFSQDYRQNVVILGDDSNEISYLLEDFLRSNRNPEIIYIHSNLSHLSKKDFLKNVIYSILHGYSGNDSNLDTLIALNTTALPTTVETIKNILKKNTFSLLEILDIVNKFINESKRKCIFIAEDFVELNGLFSNAFKDFSKFIMLQRNCMVILASSSPKETQKILSGELNMLFGNFEKILLDEENLFNPHSYLKELVLPLTPSPLFISFFVNILGSNLFYYSLFGQCIKKHYNADSEEASIKTVLTDMLYGQETYFFQKFLHKIDLIKERFKNHQTISKLLVAISEHYTRKKELAALNICDSKELLSKLSKLCEYNYIANYGNIYRIEDRLFAFWVSYIFKIYFNYPILSPHSRDGLWDKTISEDISSFKEDFLKDGVKKILELVSSFKDDNLRFGKNKYRLPSIEKTKIIEYPEKNLYLLIGEGKEIIFLAIKNAKAGDTDIIDFIEKCDAMKTKGVTKIFISLEGFTPEAQLIAKNQKLTAWDINEVNNLLRLYGKPLISVEEKIKNRITNENFSNI